MSHFDSVKFQVKIRLRGRGMIGCRQHPALIMAEFRWFSHLLRQRSAPGRWRYVGTGDPSSTGSRCRWWGALKHRMFHPRIPLDRWTFHKRCLSKNHQEWSDGKSWSLKFELEKLPGISLDFEMIALQNECWSQVALLCQMKDSSPNHHFSPEGRKTRYLGSVLPSILGRPTKRIEKVNILWL